MIYGEKSTPLTLHEELKKITVWVACQTTVNVAENLVYE